MFVLLPFLVSSSCTSRDCAFDRELFGSDHPCCFALPTSYSISSNLYRLHLQPPPFAGNIGHRITVPTTASVRSTHAHAPLLLVLLLVAASDNHRCGY
uniref:Putative secreted protein n=1 Tax=Anopheles triannulatus TaxID=58253 RepID=A0A2M4B251_9DIPT